MNKPNRFARIVAQLPMAYEGFPSTVRRADVAPLLCRQHAQMVRLVTLELNAMGQPLKDATFYCGRRAGLLWVRAALKRWRKGTR
jgi:hypothetical protein